MASLEANDDDGQNDPLAGTNANTQTACSRHCVLPKRPLVPWTKVRRGFVFAG
jgi:hypothetical protein